METAELTQREYEASQNKVEIQNKIDSLDNAASLYPILMGALIIGGLISFGLIFFSDVAESAVQEAVLVGIACFLGILARIVQAELHRVRDKGDQLREKLK